MKLQMLSTWQYSSKVHLEKLIDQIIESLKPCKLWGYEAMETLLYY